MATITIDTYVLKSGKYVIDKDPNANLDYGFDWSAWLTAADNDTIVDAEFVVDPSLTITQQGFDTTTATVWLSDGVAPAAGGLLRVTSRITTAAGRIDDRSIFLKIVER